MNQDIAKELETLAKSGTIKAAAVLEFAEVHKDSAIAKEVLSETDEEAARLHRITKCRQLIRVWVKWQPQVQRETRAVVSVPSDQTTLGAYRRTEDVLANPTYRGEMLDEAFKRIAKMREAYNYLPELDSFFNRIDGLIAQYREELGAQKKTA